MPTVSHFWELILGTIIALIPVINPLASAPTFLAITEGDTRAPLAATPHGVRLHGRDPREFPDRRHVYHGVFRHLDPGPADRRPGIEMPKNPMMNVPPIRKLTRIATM